MHYIEDSNLTEEQESQKWNIYSEVESLGSSLLYPVPESIDMDAILGEDDTFILDDSIIHNPRNAPACRYFLFDIENVEWCCKKMQSMRGTTDTFITLDRIEGEGLSRRWYGKCPYCKTPLVLSVSGFCIDKPLK